MPSFITIGRGAEPVAALGLLGLATIPVRAAHMNLNATHLRRVLLATLTATIALSSLVLPVRGVGARILASQQDQGTPPLLGNCGRSASRP
jgi:hypothetical protein